MSKQVKLRFKKLLKKAAFVQAELEFHEELIGEAKNEFSQEVANVISELSPEQKKLIEEHNRKEKLELEKRLKEAAAAADAQEEEAEEEQEGEPEEETAVAESDHEVETEEPAEPTDNKAEELKKLYRKIAAVSHPDKAKASGASGREADRLEKIFIEAKQAHDKGNWFLLYSLALDLDLDVDNPTQEHLDWLEEDIRQTMVAVSAYQNVLAWMWYNGNDQTKQVALANFFEQVYGISLGPITLTPDMIGAKNVF
mgnify:CR=1 FL=1